MKGEPTQPSWRARLRLVYARLRSWLVCCRLGLRNVHSLALVQSPQISISPDVVIREYAFIGRYCQLGPQVEIGRYCMLAPCVSVVGGDHDYHQPGVPIIFAGRGAMRRTVIEDDVWVGCGTIIMAGVRIGRGAIIAAGSVVTKDIEPYEIHAGVPARKLHDRFNTEERAIHDSMLRAPASPGTYCQRRVPT